MNVRRYALLLAALLRASADLSAQEPNPPYALGQGVPVGAGMRLGGYLALDWEKPSGVNATLTFDDLSLFVFGDAGPRFRYFLEIEDSKFWHLSDGHAQVTHHGDLERLYLDYLHDDAFKIRAGKFLTPVGTWNEIHPDPLTWTVSRPLASYATFPTFMTGAMAYGTIAGDANDLDYNVFVQANPCLDCNTGDRQTERTVGGRVRWRSDRVEIGVPAVYYRDRLTDDAVALTGADLLVRASRVEVRGEATVSRVERALAGDAASEHAWYLQGLLALTDRHFLVARGERARSRAGDRWHAWTLGALYRPKPPISLKLEYQSRDGYFPVEEAGAGSRVLAGFGVLF